MSNDPSSGDQPGWQGQQPYPGYGQQRGEQPGYGASAYPPPTQQGGYGQAPPAWAPPGGQPGGAYPGGTPGGYPGPAGLGGSTPQGQAPGFMAAMTDFGFNSFATPVVIKVLYILSIVGIALFYLFSVISGFSVGAAYGLGVLVGGGILALVALIYIRVLLEVLYASVRTAEDIRVLRNRP
jgi:uncharacterized protein DUF4282